MPRFYLAAALGLGLAAAPMAASAHGIEGKEFAFEPSKITVSAGEQAEITFHNAGNLSHNLTIPALNVATPTIQAGASHTVSFTPESSGTYKIICSVPGHKQAGMTGKLVVE